MLRRRGYPFDAGDQHSGDGEKQGDNRDTQTRRAESGGPSAETSACPLCTGMLAHPKSRICVLAFLGIIVFLASSSWLLLMSSQSRSIYKESVDYAWNRFLWKMSVHERSRPKGMLASNLPTRRQNLEMISRTPSFQREDFYVKRHLELLHQDMGRSAATATATNNNTTVVLLWSKNYKTWNVRRPRGVIKGCNIPCKWAVSLVWHACSIDWRTASVKTSRKNTSMAVLSGALHLK